MVMAMMQPSDVLADFAGLDGVEGLAGGHVGASVTRGGVRSAGSDSATAQIFVDPSFDARQNLALATLGTTFGTSTTNAQATRV